MENIWKCKIGGPVAELLLKGADSPMRQAVERAYFELTGQYPKFTFSGWAGSLTESERAVVENRLPDANLLPPSDELLSRMKALYEYVEYALQSDMTEQDSKVFSRLARFLLASPLRSGPSERTA